MQYNITLDYPPSINQYYISWAIGKRVMMAVSTKGKAYQLHTKRELYKQLGNYSRLTGRLRMAISISRYDRREYDIDNYLKPLIDALKQFAFVDDSQIDELKIVRLPVSESGYCEVIIEQIAKSKKTGMKTSSKTTKASIYDRLKNSGKRKR